MRALITGIAGFTGRYLAEELAGAGYKVFGLVRREPSSSLPFVSRVFVCDLLDPAQLRVVVETVQPDVVVHLAAISFLAHKDVEAIYRTNLLGTRHLFEALLPMSSSLKTVLLASSANIYGNAKGGALDEMTPPAPANDYAISKLAMEYVARLYVDRLPMVIVRPFNYTGRGQAEHFLIPKIVAHARRRAAFIELGNLNIARDFSDVRMVVHCYRRLLETPAAIGGTFNVCSGKAYTLQDILFMARNISGYDMEVRVNPALVRENEVKILLGDRTRLESVIGQLKDIPLDETLRWMIEDE
ncbi:GDP-mannose 4,6-dehydratase [Caenispirillum bisanense]|uniref:GDP-mannose 4,6-dehydratase n=1 Tax=Caenispirillum bisanense TaxID=414052 RepID=UPI0031DB59A6